VCSLVALKIDFHYDLDERAVTGRLPKSTGGGWWFRAPLVRVVGFRTHIGLLVGFYEVLTPVLCDLDGCDIHLLHHMAIFLFKGPYFFSFFLLRISISSAFLALFSFLLSLA